MSGVPRITLQSFCIQCYVHNQHPEFRAAGVSGFDSFIHRNTRLLRDPQPIDFFGELPLRSSQGGQNSATTWSQTLIDEYARLKLTTVMHYVRFKVATVQLYDYESLLRLLGYCPVLPAVACQNGSY